MRASFVFYRSFYESMAELPPEQKGLIFDAICDYALNQNIPDFTGVEKAIFTLIKPYLDNEYKNIGAGDSHWNWKGGVSNENKLIRNSSAMRAWRNSVFERDNYTCQKCFIKGGKLNAHHIKLFSEYPELRTKISNGMTLCASCHRNEHKKAAI